MDRYNDVDVLNQYKKNNKNTCTYSFNSKDDTLSQK
jgi:hypothetical protein